MNYNNISTMSNLQAQLAHLKNQQRSRSANPHHSQPSLLLPPKSVASVSSDLVYTAAIIAYDALLSQQPSLRNQGQVVMSENNRNINRNQLNKAQNRQWSQVLIKFMINLNPFFAGEGCQRVMEYLLRNYKVNVFEGQAMAIVFLQHWNSPLYADLCRNIPQKIVGLKLAFLAPILKGESLNFTYLLKHFSYNNQLISTVTIYILEYLKTESTPNLDIEVPLGEEQSMIPQAGALARLDPRKFLLQIFNEFANRSMKDCYKYILQFCNKAVTPKATSQTISMVMYLASRLMIDQALSDDLLAAILLKLIGQTHSSVKQNSGNRLVYDFVMLVWQRRPNSINSQQLKILQLSQPFISYLSRFSHSLSSILIRLLQLHLQGAICSKIIQAIGCRIKNCQFYRQHSEVYHQKLFAILEKGLMSIQGQAKFIIDFFRQNFQKQTAVYYDKKSLPNKQLQQKILSIFSTKCYKILPNSTLSFNLNMIAIKQPAKVVKQVLKQSFDQKKQVSDQESEEENLIPKKSNQSLLSRLKKYGLTVKVLEYEDSQTKKALLQFLEEYYDKKSTEKISVEQKNRIYQQYLDHYNYDSLTYDINQGDFSTGVKYLSAHFNIQCAKICLQQMSLKIQLNQSVLFRQLIRLSLRQLRQQADRNYKLTITYLNKLFKDLAQRNSQNQADTARISQIMVRISQGMFSGDLRKGKYHKILHNHGAILANMILSLKIKSSVSKTEQPIISQHFSSVVGIFGKENLYLLNTAIVEVLTRKQLDHSYLRYYISHVLIPNVAAGTFDHYDLTFSVIKTLVLCSQLSSLIGIDPKLIENSFKHGIAKHAVTDFFGFVKEKFKKVLTRKLLLFLRSFYQSSLLVQGFKRTLTELGAEPLNSLLSLFTELYRLLSLLQTEDQKVEESRTFIIGKITNLFPLDLRLIVFEPLLPNQHLYSYLAQQLQDHAPEKSSFPVLARLMNIAPEQVSKQWVDFTRQSLKRGFKQEEKLVDEVIKTYCQGENSSNYARLMCEWAQYNPELLHGHLDAVMQILAHHCSAPDNFSLALISRMIKYLGQIIEPYLSNLLVIALSVQSQYTYSFVAEFVKNLAPSTLIQLVRQTYKKTTHLVNFGILFREVASVGVGDSLNKTLLNFANRVLTQVFTEEQTPGQQLHLVSQIFVKIALKMNQNQLRKAIIQLSRWSELRSEIQGSLPFNLRKIVVSQVYCLLAEQLGSLFNPFYGYTLQPALKDFNSIVQNHQTKSTATLLKRPRQQPQEYHQQLAAHYLALSLKSLELLFTNDREYQFLDSVKIQSLGDPLADLVMLTQRGSFKEVISKEWRHCMLQLHQCITDDYQMKTINYKILLMLKRKNPQVHRQVFQFIDELVDALKDRFLMLVGDLVPFLLQGATSRDQGVSSAVRSIINKVEELSGEQINVFAK